MAKRGYKFYEVEAHASNVKCIKIGKKSCGLFVTGGEDHRVNLWAIGKSSSLLSLFGHTCPVESVTFDSEEVLVVSGASGGAIKLWDLEEAKIVRTIAGHRTNCTSVEFHPFGEFFASGSLDANLKIWDIRRKGCIHTYKGHTQGINTIRFTPDGRWVVTGGEDNVVKLWDLTAGKLLHDFKFHEGQIRCIDFHPHEFLLATGSADGTVKFWDLETFELIGSAGPEATGVRSMIFHPDGRTLFCGFDESLKVFSWEPIICHDALDMGWSTLCDLSIHEGNLFGCSYHQSTVGVWVAHTSLIGPYAAGILPKSSEPIELKYIVGQNQSAQQIQSNIKSSEKLLTTEQDCGAKDMMRSLSVKSTESSHSAPRIIYEVPLPSTISKSRGSKSSTLKKSSMIEVQTRNSGQLISRQVTVPGIVPRNSSDMEQAVESRKEIPANESILPVNVFSKPSCERKLPSVNRDIARHCNAQESGPLSGKTNDLVSAVDQNFCSGFIAKDSDTESSVNFRVVAEKFEKILSPDTPLSNRPVNVQPGRTRSLVERWEQRERCINTDAPTTKSSSLMAEADTLRPSEKAQKESSGNDLIAPANEDATENLMQNHDSFISVLQSRLTKLQVVRHFWIRNDIKGAINAVGRLPDHSVQADVVNILMDRIDVVTLNIFTCLLPLLTGLIDSKVDRHIIISLELLLKLVKIFGPVINSTVSSSSPIGVDLQAEERRNHCTQCFVQLQKIKQLLPAVIRRGGLLAKPAMELNLAIQEF
ncbi:hypothetical protein AAC387_Pa06g3250 [Persea americana]